MRFFLYLFLILNITSLSCQDNIESYNITLNIKNIKSKGNLFIAIWTDSNAFNSNKSDSSESKNGFKYGFKESVNQKYFNKTIKLPIRPDRKISMGMKWMISYARKRNEKSMALKLASEILAAEKEEGASVKKKVDVHKMAEANKAFSHFRF